MLNAKNEKLYLKIMLITYIIIQLFLLNRFSFLRNDETQLIILFLKLKQSIFNLLIPGNIEVATGGQTITHFILALSTKVSKNIIFLKSIPLAFSIASIPLIYNFFKDTKFKFHYLISTLIVFHPSFLFYATDFKQYILDIFFTFLFLNLINKKNLKPIYRYLTCFLCFQCSAPAALILLSYLGALFILSDNKKTEIKLLSTTLVSVLTYLVIFNHNYPKFKPYMNKHWGRIENSLILKFNSGLDFVNIIINKLNTIFLSFTMSDLVYINIFLVVGLITMFRKHRLYFYFLLILLTGIILASLIGQYPIRPVIHNSLKNFYLTKERTTFFLVPFCSFLYFALLEFISGKLKNKLSFTLILSFLFIAPLSYNYSDYFNSGFSLARAEEAKSVLNNIQVLSQFEKAYVSDWEVDLFKFFIEKNSKTQIVKQSDSDKNPPKKTDVFLIHFLDKELSKFTQPGKFIYKGRTKTHHIFINR